MRLRPLCALVLVPAIHAGRLPEAADHEHAPAVTSSPLALAGPDGRRRRVHPEDRSGHFPAQNPPVSLSSPCGDQSGPRATDPVQDESHVTPDERARRERLTIEHMPMASRLAARYRCKGIEPEDFEAEAFLALAEAASTHDLAYDPASFASYATRAIRTRLRELIERHGITRTPAPEPLPADPDEFAIVPTDTPERRELAAFVESALAAVSPTGRRMIELVALEGHSIRSAGRELQITHWQARTEHDLACLTLAAACRRAGHDEATWTRAIA